MLLLTLSSTKLLFQDTLSFQSPKLNLTHLPTQLIQTRRSFLTTKNNLSKALPILESSQCQFQRSLRRKSSKVLMNFPIRRKRLNIKLLPNLLNNLLRKLQEMNCHLRNKLNKFIIQIPNMLKRSKSHCQFRKRRQLRIPLQLQNLNNQKCHLQQSRNQSNQNLKLLQKLLNTLHQPKSTLLLQLQDLRLFLNTSSNLLTSHNQFTKCHSSHRELLLHHSRTQSTDLKCQIFRCQRCQRMEFQSSQPKCHRPS